MQTHINMDKISLIPIGMLKPHEATVPEKVLALLLKILKEGRWLQPIIIHNKTFTIMDGHHRYKAALLLGLKLIPCFLLNYEKDVVVCSRRANYIITPNSIIQHSTKNKLYPYKTTKHQFCPTYKLKTLNLPIKGLL